MNGKFTQEEPWSSLDGVTVKLSACSLSSHEAYDNHAPCLTQRKHSILLGINPAPAEALPDAQPNVTSSR